jgi:UDP-N-acetylglucosamine 1-carboxyvinyltransferase
MDKIIIKGERRLSGVVSATGSKNAGLPLMAASLLSGGKYSFTNVPNIKDIQTMAELLRMLGAKVTFEDHIMQIDTTQCSSFEAPYELVKTMRASIYVLGPLLARFGKARVSFPGGCALGARPIDLHIKGFQKLGAKIDIEHGYINAWAKKLRGNEIIFEKKSVGATANILMAAVLAEGTTTIQNTALEPEVVALEKFLVKMGADIKGIGTDCLTINGVSSLHPADESLIPDRIETATLLLAGAITRGNVTVESCQPDHLGIVIEKLREIGFKCEIDGDRITITNQGKKSPIEISTNPYPGFPTDLHPPFAALLCTINGKSFIDENIFSDRFMYLSELQRLGADVILRGNRIVIDGGKKLTGAPLMVSDIRAGASLILAALAAKGESTISRVYHLDRGYEDLKQKLASLGADITRVV